MPTYPIHGRPRKCKTCLSCRANKVRCDRGFPCSNCIKRKSTCSYGRPPFMKLPNDPTITTVSSPPLPPSTFVFPSIPPYAHSETTHNLLHAPKATARASAERNLSDIINISREEWDEANAKLVAMEGIIGNLHSIFQAHSTCGPPGPGSIDRGKSLPLPESFYGAKVLKTGAVYLGSRSVLVDILNKLKMSEDTAAQTLSQDDLLTELALGGEAATYPFVALWSSDPLTFDLTRMCAMLPDDGQCSQFLAFYRDVGSVLYPVICDLSQIERYTTRLLEGRKRTNGTYNPDTNALVNPFGMNLAFLGLLFAVLASGCQLSDIPEYERQLTSGVYVSCAYQCLRMLNYLSHPTVEVIQILLIISNVLSYNMNASASYPLLGMTERMCLVLGLHVESPGVSIAEQAVRRRIWWTMAFQNSHFSLAYDRPSITVVSRPEIPLDPTSMPGHRSYFETLCRVVSVSLDGLRSHMFPASLHKSFHEIREYKNQVQQMLVDATPHLRYRDNCRTLSDHIERIELRLHSSYFLSVMCYVSLDPHAHLDDQHRAVIREDCIYSLINTVDAFVELHELNYRCSRSWVSLQRSITSALLLVANDNSTQTSQLIQRLEMVLADHDYTDSNENRNHCTDSAKHHNSSLHAPRENR